MKITRELCEAIINEWLRDSNIAGRLSRATSKARRASNEVTRGEKPVSAEREDQLVGRFSRVRAMGIDIEDGAEPKEVGKFETRSGASRYLRDYVDPFPTEEKAKASNPPIRRIAGSN